MIAFFHGVYDTSLMASKYSCPVASGLSVGICNPYQFGVPRSPNFRPGKNSEEFATMQVAYRLSSEF
jgi:hypothetical protein